MTSKRRKQGEDSDSNEEGGPYYKVHKKQRRGAGLHAPEVEQAQHNSLSSNSRDRNAQEFARVHLRPSSVLESERIHYRNIALDTGSFGSSFIQNRPLGGPERVDYDNRMAVLKDRLSITRPHRFEAELWQRFRAESISVLSEYYPKTRLEELATYIQEHSRPPKRRPLSAETLLIGIRDTFPGTEIASIFELKHLMKALSFKFANIHIGYYIRVSQRFDVIAHRDQYIPLLRLAMTDPRFFYINVDWSFFYENAFTKHAWIPLTEPNSDLLEDGKPGKGQRLGSCEFIIHTGLLQHPDGGSAGTIFEIGEIVDGDKVLDCISRGCVAIRNHPAVKDHGLIPVLVIDGARTNTTKPKGFIEPSKMNLSDGGANRVPMNGIGLKGLRSVLEESGKWVGHMGKAEAETLLWSSNLVRSQLTEVESICKENGIVCLYNCKAHPWLAPIEKFWRLTKSRLENLFDFSQLRSEYLSIVSQSLRREFELVSRSERWFNLSLKYAEYYARGGTEIVREFEMKRLDLSSMPPPKARYRFKDISTMFEDAHNTNWILIRGRKWEGAHGYW